MRMAFNHFLNTEEQISEKDFNCLLLKASKYVGRIIEVKEATGGNVNYVYRVRGTEDTIFIKIRGNRFSRLPSIETKTEYIKYEFKALELLAREIQGIFPQVLEFDEEMHALFLTNVFHNSTSFEEKLHAQQASIDDMHVLGETVGIIHKATTHITEGIREDQDIDFRNRTLHYWLESSSHPRLLEISSQYKTFSDRNVIVGDLSPKNMSIHNGKIGICDLENTHLGAHIFDLACIMAHMLLHYITWTDKARTYLQTVYSAYVKQNSLAELNDPLLLYTLLGIAMYRLVNPVIPYKLHIDQNTRVMYHARCRQALNMSQPTLDNILDLLKQERTFSWCK